MSVEPTIAIAVSARSWPDVLRQTLADHGGGRVRVTALSPGDLADEEYSILLIDDTSSFLSRGLVADEHRRGRVVVGVHDPEEPAGLHHLENLGVDETISCDASPAAFVSMLGRLHSQPVQTPAPAEVDPPQPSTVLVRGISGGVGASEVALALAIELGDAVVVDLAEWPSLAQRTSAAVHPNLASAAEVVDHGDGDLTASLQRIAGSASLLAGIPGGGANVVRSLPRILAALEETAEWTVLDMGIGTERMLASTLPTIVVTSASPVGLTRCIDRLGSSDLATTHVVCNRAPRGRFESVEVESALAAEMSPRSLVVAPEDVRVRTAGWNGTAVTGGPFRRAMAVLAAHVREMS